MRNYFCLPPFARLAGWIAGRSGLKRADACDFMMAHKAEMATVAAAAIAVIATKGEAISTLIKGGAEEALAGTAKLLESTPITARLSLVKLNSKISNVMIQDQKYIDSLILASNREHLINNVRISEEGISRLQQLDHRRSWLGKHLICNVKLFYLVQLS